MNAAGAGRKNLVVVRAGKNSLHPQWLAGAEERSWDLIVSAYDPEARFEHPADVRMVLKPGGKWDGIHHLLAGSDLLSRYEYVWLPDDDIAASCANIDAIFNSMRCHELEVAQPALSRNSYFTHFAVTACPGFRLRFTNFVEIMVPCLKSSLLAEVLDDFRNSMSGFGMDLVWCRLSPQPRFKAAILDAITVRHTRPVGKVLRGNMAGRGLSPEVDRNALSARYNLSEGMKPVIYAAVDDNGRLREGRKRLGLAMAFRYLGVLGQFKQKHVAIEKIVQLIRRQIAGRFDLTPLLRLKATSLRT